MTPVLLPPRLQGLIVKALGSSQYITQADLDVLWTSFIPGDPPDKNKLAKANALIRKMALADDADRQLIDLLNEVFYFSAESDLRRGEAETFKPLLVAMLERKFTVDPDIGLQRPDARSPTFADERDKNYGSLYLDPTKAQTVRTQVEQIGDGRSVFIVHGRNSMARNELSKFLKHLDAKPVTWNQAAKLTKKPSPSTMEIINAGMDYAQAIVVLFTPDDEAQLKKDFVESDDGQHERALTGQARQNVILEAGMALAIAKDRTILVRLGRTRPVSDIEGVNWIDLGDSWDHRERLKDALINAKVVLDQSVNLLGRDAGRFSEVPVGQLSSEPDPEL